MNEEWQDSPFGQGRDDENVDGADDEDNEFPPIMPTTTVWTKEANPEFEKEIPWELGGKRRWGVEGMAVDAVRGKIAWYQVLHKADGTTGFYHQTELSLWPSGGDNSDEPSCSPDDDPKVKIPYVPAPGLDRNYFLTIGLLMKL